MFEIKKHSEKEIERYRKIEGTYRKEIAAEVSKLLERMPEEKREIARILGYKSTTQLSKWKDGGATIPPEKIALLCLVLGKKVDWVFPDEIRRRSYYENIENAIYNNDYKSALRLIIERIPDVIEDNN